MPGFVLYRGVRGSKGVKLVGRRLIGRCGVLCQGRQIGMGIEDWMGGICLVLSCLQVHIVLYARTADRPPQSTVVRLDCSNALPGTRYYITVQDRCKSIPALPSRGGRSSWPLVSIGERAFISPRRVSVLGLDGSEWCWWLKERVID
jgi:hypothetical protein